jgi:hypothetical protein
LIAGAGRRIGAVDMDGTASLTAPPDTVFAEVADLGTYTGWLGIVFGAERSPAADGDPGPAWLVDLGAKFGPIPLTKKVRMVRTEHVAPKLVRFERKELDGSEHSAWILTAEVEVADGGSTLTMNVHYGGAGRLPGIDSILRDEIRKGGARLQARLDADSR